MNTVGLRRATGRFAWVERRLFEILGGWVPTVAEPEVKVFLRVQSFEHAWHAELWEGLAPRSGPAAGNGDAQAAVVGPVLDLIAAPAATAERLAGVYRVLLPHLVDAYRALVAVAAPASDGPLGRALGLMLADDGLAIPEGERLIQGLTGDSAAHQRRVEALLTKGGGAIVPDLA